MYYKVYNSRAQKWEVRKNNDFEWVKHYKTELEANQDMAFMRGEPVPHAVVGQEVFIVEPQFCVGGKENPLYGQTLRGIVIDVYGDLIDVLIYHNPPLSSTCLKYYKLQPVYKAKNCALGWKD